MFDDSTTETTLGDEQSVPLLSTWTAVRKPSSHLHSIRKDDSMAALFQKHPNDSFVAWNTNPKIQTKNHSSLERSKKDLLPLKKRARIVVPETTVSPATQTLNELNGMDLLEDNLYTQLSQVSYSQALFDGNVCGDDDNNDDCNSATEETKAMNRRIQGNDIDKGVIAAVYDPGFKVILGKCATEEEAERRRRIAKSAIFELRSKYGYLQMKDKDWLYTQLENMGIRKLDQNVQTNTSVQDIVPQRMNKNVKPVLSPKKDLEKHLTRNEKENIPPMEQTLKEHVKNKGELVAIEMHKEIPSNNHNLDLEKHASSEDSEIADSIPDIPAYDGEPLVKLRVYYGKLAIHLGTFYKTCSERRLMKAKQLIQKWNKLPIRPTADWVKSELTRLGYRNVCPRGGRYETKSKAKANINATESDASIGVLPQESQATVVEKTSQLHSPSDAAFIPKEYAIENITISEVGPIGCTVTRVTVDTVDTCQVTSLNQEGSAYKNGLRENDIIIHSIRSSNQVNSERRNSADGIVFATVDEVKAWTNSDRRPISFDVIRCFVSNSKEVETEETQPIEKFDLSYLNITEADVEKAIQSRKQFPKIPCCKKCNIHESFQHHYLCSMHKNFSTSGAKEILVILLAGARDGCQACGYEVSFGKKHPSLTHISNCDRMSKKNDETSKKREASNTKAKSQISSLPRANTIIDNNSTLKKRKLVVDDAFVELSQLSRKKSYFVSVETPRTNQRMQMNVTSIKADEKQLDADHPEIKLQKHSPLILADESSEDRWVSCANPWGPMGFCEGDVVYSSAVDYKYKFQIYGENPKRFIDEPFIAGSSYCKTHFIKETVALKRDPMALMEWGFEFSHHDFGGACIVNRVDIMSPAADARVVGDPDKVSAIQEGDIILLINGKRVGSMTELDLAVELEVSRSWISLTVAKYNRESVDGNKSLNWRSIDDAIEFESKEASSSNAGASSLINSLNDKKAIDFFREENKENTTTRKSSSLKSCSMLSKIQNDTVVVTPLIVNESKNHSVANLIQDPVEKDDIFDSDDSYESDENPWLPCICGEEHFSQHESLFWIQCDECEAWFKCSSQCIGFSEQDAEKIEKWICVDCTTTSITALNMKSSCANKDMLESTETEAATPMKENPADCAKHPFVAGTLVQVEDRSWMPGRYLGGGTAKILSYKSVNQEYLYDVQYIHGGKENYIDSKYVSLYQPIETPRSSRSRASVVCDDNPKQH